MSQNYTAEDVRKLVPAGQIRRKQDCYDQIWAVIRDSIGQGDYSCYYPHSYSLHECHPFQSEHQDKLEKLGYQIDRTGRFISWEHHKKK